MKQFIKFAFAFIAICGIATAVSSCEDTPPVKPTPTPFAITLTDDGNGTAKATIDGAEVTEALAGETVTITATPDDEHSFDKWTVESGDVELANASSRTTTLTMPAGEVAIKATFQAPQPKFAITFVRSTGGTAVATLDGETITEVEANTTVTITATPADGYSFETWSTTTEGVAFESSTTSTTTFTMPAGEVSIEAAFTPLATLYPITFESTNGTAVATLDGETVTEAKVGETITVTATPADGYVFGIWASETAGVVFKDAVAASTTFTMPASGVVVKAEFIDAGLDVFTKIPDANFKSVCNSFDTDKDGILSLTEAAAVTQIKATYRRIASLEGIEYFRNLTHLDCSMQSISNSPLTSLDLSKNTALVELNCQINSIATLDLSKNTNLTTVLAQQNKLTSIVTPESDILTKLDVNQNLLTSLDLSKLPNLETLMCSINKLTSLDLSKNTKLQFLFCSDNDLKSIDVSKNLELLELYCSRAGLTSVDISKNEKLMDLGVISNNLTTVNLTNNPDIIWLELMDNKITSLNVSQNTKLTDLQVQDNLLTSLDVSNNPELSFFYCYNNQITSLDVSQNPRLNNLKCWNNRMSQLDASNMRLDLGVFYVHCGHQTTDGTTEQTLTLTMREDMKAFYNKNLANAKDSGTGFLYNYNVVLAE